MAVAVAFLLLGFLLGLLSLAIAEGAALLWAIRSLTGRPSADQSPQALPVHPPRPRHNDLLIKRQGFLWILANQGKTPKDSINHPPNGGSTSQGIKEQKLITEVFPVKMLAKLEDHWLTLSAADGSQQLTIQLLNCTVVAVSASNLPSRKWAKRYPIKLESKESEICSGSKVCYVYADTSWEKESWCKALRLASTTDKDKLKFHATLTEEFSGYMSSLSAAYPCFLKPSRLSGPEHVVVEDNTVRPTDGSSKVRSFLRRLAKKASRESKKGPAPSPKQDSIKQRSTPSSSVSLSSQQSDSDSHNAMVDEKLADDATLCWNLLISRLFFDAKMNDEINKAIKARAQRTLSNTRTPSYIGEITLTDLNLGRLPPYLHRMRALPLDSNESWAFEVDFECSSGMLLQIETRLEVQEPELEKDMMKTSLKDDSNGDVSSDFLDSIEQYGNQLKSSEALDSAAEGNNEEDALRKAKSTGWTSAYMSRWKSILHSIADQVSQVPLSLAIKMSSIRGTMRVHIKPPPSDRIWFGFTSMPEIEWELESSIGDRKITSSHIASLIGNRIKASVRRSMVLPNCESIPISWMISDTDDWVPRKAAPFIWLNREPAEASSSSTRRATDTTGEPPGETFVSKAIAKSKSSPWPSSTIRIAKGSLNKSVDGPEQAEASTSWQQQKMPLLSSSSRDETAGLVVEPEDRALPSAAGEEGGVTKRKRGGRRARVMHFVGKKMLRENARSNSLLLPELERPTTPAGAAPGPGPGPTSS